MWGGLKWLPGKTPVKAEGVTVNAWSGMTGWILLFPARRVQVD